MSCQRCNSNRIASVGAKTSDRCTWQTTCPTGLSVFWRSAGGSLNSTGFAQDRSGICLNDYAPENVGIGGGDYVDFEYCLDCGQMQGEFPISEAAVETVAEKATSK